MIGSPLQRVIKRSMDSDINFLSLVDRFETKVIEMCKTENWRHPDITYCAYNGTKGEFILRMGNKVYTLMISPDPTPDKVWKHNREDYIDWYNR